MEPNIKEVAGRIRALREDMDLTLQEMAEATGRSTAEYAAQESGEEDLSFTFLYKCAEKFGVDVIELLTGENPHLTGLLAHARGRGPFHQAPRWLRVPAQGAAFPPQAGRALRGHRSLFGRGAGRARAPVPSRGPGARLHHLRSDAIRLRGPRGDPESGDVVMYDSGRGHGMIATGGEPCVFLAIVMKPEGEKII